MLEVLWRKLKMQSENWVCIDRIRNKQGLVVSYILQNCMTHQKVKLIPATLRSLMHNGELSVLNLKLSSDNKILLQKSKFQDTVDKSNIKYSNNTDIQNSLENAVDKFVCDMTNFKWLQDTNKLIKLIKINTQGDTNTFTLGVRTDLYDSKCNSSNGSHAEILFRYRKNIERVHGNHEYKASIIVQMLSIKYADGHVELVEKAPDFKIGAFSFNVPTAKINYDMNKAGDDFLKYTSKQCSRLCGKRFNNDHMKGVLGKVKGTAIKQGIQCVAYGLIIVACVGALSSCGTANAKDYTESVVAEQTVNETTYDCDYKTLSPFKTRITTEVDGETVEITGNLIHLFTDPLTMKDSNGNIIGDASDKYCLFTNDDHVISLDGKVEAVMTGDFNIVGKSYQIYNASGEQIGAFKRSLLGYSGTITDMNGNLIAKYGKYPFMNDYSVTVYKNDKLSDKAILLITASFVSDDRADSASSSSSNTSNNR